MKLVNRYKKGTLFSKISLWGSLASIISILFFFKSCLPLFYNNSEKNDIIEASIELSSSIEFYNIYFTNFNSFIIYHDNQPIPKDAVPNKIAGYGKFRFFGLHPHIKLSIFNNSAYPMTISLVKAQLELCNYKFGLLDLNKFYTIDFKEKKEFPLYFNPQEQKVINLSFTWPTSDKIKNKLSELTEDSLYTAPYLLHSLGVGVAGHPAGFEHKLRGLLFNDLREQFNADTTVECKITINVFNANGQSDSTEIFLSKKLNSQFIYK